MQTFAEICTLALVCLFAHRELIPAAPSLLNADGAVYPITAEWIRQGHWVPFQIHYPHGGNTLTLLRAGWISIFGLPGQFSFSYWVAPFLVALSFYALVRVYASRLAALFVGLVAAVGFKSWDIFMCIEFYSAYLILGALILAVRGPGATPFVRFSKSKLFAASALCGLAFYTCRASIVYIVPFFVSAGWAWAELKGVLRARNHAERWTLRAAALLFGLYLYLELFGGVIGSWDGKAIKLHASPNLHYAAVLLGVLWISRRRELLTRENWIRAICVGAGFVVGLMPELIPALSKGGLPPGTGTATYSFAETFTAIGLIPHALETLFSYTNSLAGHASIALMILSLAGLVLHVRSTGSVSPIVFSAVLALWAYVRIMTYDLAPPRYLLPIFPALMVGLAWMVDRLRSHRQHGVGLLLLLLALAVVHSSDQLRARKAWADEATASGREERIRRVIHSFRELGVDYVISDDYWQSNQYTVLAGWSPYFVADPPTWMHPLKTSEAAAAEEVGILLRAPASKSTVVHLGREWTVTPVGRVGDLYLYHGR